MKAFSLLPHDIKEDMTRHVITHGLGTVVEEFLKSVSENDPAFLKQNIRWIYPMLESRHGKRVKNAPKDKGEDLYSNSPMHFLKSLGRLVAFLPGASQKASRITLLAEVKKDVGLVKRLYDINPKMFSKKQWGELCALQYDELTKTEERGWGGQYEELELFFGLPVAYKRRALGRILKEKPDFGWELSEDLLRNSFVFKHVETTLTSLSLRWKAISKIESGIEDVLYLFPVLDEDTRKLVFEWIVDIARNRPQNGALFDAFVKAVFEMDDYEHPFGNLAGPLKRVLKETRSSDFLERLQTVFCTQ